MGVTLNKDGTPRKIGSGKTKGAGCYENITLRELRKLVNENAEVSVSRVWLRNAQTERQAHSLSYDIKPPKVKPEYTKPSTELKSSNKTTVSPSKSEKVNINSIEDDEYEPPPLFASDSGVQNY
ncbi:MAG: hypothetical protein VX609_03260 [Verrucomicrobiota bacterium]|nr:hypothetical protein [Verrucomicrobiota bacterium]|tara:strand:+ start:142 stop:513 length:372 start_codon:yes stop_codon:yes gene_type:complete